MQLKIINSAVFFYFFINAYFLGNQLYPITPVNTHKKAKRKSLLAFKFTAYQISTIPEQHMIYKL